MLVRPPEARQLLLEIDSSFLPRVSCKRNDLFHVSSIAYKRHNRTLKPTASGSEPAKRAVLVDWLVIAGPNLTYLHLESAHILLIFAVIRYHPFLIRFFNGGTSGDRRIINGAEILNEAPSQVI